MPDQKISKRSAAETITPLRPGGEINKKDPPAGVRRGCVKILALGVCLLLLIGGGGWLLHWLADNSSPPQTSPGSRSSVKTTARETISPACEKRAPVPADPVQLKQNRQEAKQKIAIDAAKSAPQRGRKRGKTIETVTQLMASARQHEKNGDFAGALADWQKAVEIDPDAGQARRALKRVRHLIAGQRFQQLMSEGLAALYASDYRAARSKLLQARQIKPGSREVADALSQVDQALRLERMEKLGRKARAAEKAEDWQQALKAYLAVLEMDASIQFAIQGKSRALEQLRLSKRLDFFLTNPHVLESDRQLHNAVLLLAEVETTALRGSKLSARFARLQQLVKTAQTPVRVIIESDNRTRVAVYRVGKLGRFAVHELQLRPGTYTVVGSRDGYQDVRRRIVVKAGQPIVRLSIACRVKI